VRAELAPATARASDRRVGALGGTCVNVGCIPKKIFAYAAHFARFSSRAELRRDVGGRDSTGRLARQQDRRFAAPERRYERVLQLAGVEILRRARPRARLPTKSRFNGKRISGEDTSRRHRLLAVLQQIPGREQAVTSNEAFHLERLRRARGGGGGYIALDRLDLPRPGREDHALLTAASASAGFDTELGEAIEAERKAKA